MPFARVGKVWTHSNQSVPIMNKRKFPRRQLAPTVQGISLDTNFAAVDPNVNGDVNVVIQASTFSGNGTVVRVTQEPLRPADLATYSNRSLMVFNSTLRRPEDHIILTLTSQSLSSTSHSTVQTALPK